MNGKIRTLVFLGFTALAATASGCIIDDSSGPDSCSVYRYVSLDWNIQSNATGQFLSCDQAGASSVELNFGPNSFAFQCSFGGNGGITTRNGIEPGTYNTTVELISSDSSGSDLSVTPPMSLTMANCSPTYIPTVTFGI